MKKNTPLQINTVNNGFVVRPAISDEHRAFCSQESLVFESKHNLFAYLNEHFTESSVAKTEDE